MAAGLSKVGLNPVVHTIAPFLIERSYEQIKIDLCYNNLKTNLVSVGNSFDYSGLGCTHHCPNDVMLINNLPNIDDWLDQDFIKKKVKFDVEPTEAEIATGVEESLVQ